MRRWRCCEATEVLEVMGVLEAKEVLEVIRCVLFCMVEAMEVLEAMALEVPGGDALCARHSVLETLCVGFEISIVADFSLQPATIWHWPG